MEKILPIHLQEVVFSSSQPSLSRQIAQLEKDRKLRKIAPRIYTPNFEESPETIIRRNLFTVLGRLYPGAVLSHRSALEFKPTAAGHLFLTYTYTKKINLPGVILRFMQGPGPIEGDNPLSGELFVSQMERALLENMEVSRQPRPESKILTLPEIEDRLENVIRVKGEAGLNEVRDKAREIAQKLDMETEFDKLNKLISALLTTKPSKLLSSPLAVARAFGNPYDPARLSRFEKLFRDLKQQEFNEGSDICRYFELLPQDAEEKTLYVQMLQEEDPLSRKSVKIREKIVLPLLSIQQYALMKIQKGEGDKAAYEKLVTRSLFGNINASRNSA